MKKRKLVHLPTRKQIRKWVEALRSGEYTQTKSHLQDEHGHCCLGVGCEVSINKRFLKRDGHGFLIGATPRIVQPVRPWLKNIDDSFKTIMGRRLTTLNDSEGFTFDEIADMLELAFIHNDPQYLYESEEAGPVFNKN